MIKQAFRRYGIGECTLCDREWDEHQGIAGYVFKQNRKINEQYTRHVGICDTCLKQIRLAEVPEPKSENEVFITGCLAPLVGFGKLEQVQLDGGEIEPENIKPKETAWFDDSGNTYFKGVVETCLATDELKSKVEQLQLLRDTEKEAQLNLKALEERFKEEPFVGKAYIPRAQRLVDQVGKAIDNLIGGLL